MSEPTIAQAGLCYRSRVPKTDSEADITMATFAALFDMDGVLVDSVGLNWQAYNAVLAEHGVHIGDDQLPKYVGRSLADQVAMLNHDHGLRIDSADFAARARMLKKELFVGIEPKPGVEALLQELAEADIPLAVGTSTARDIAIERLRTAGLLERFPVVVAEADVPAHKPHPDVYLRAARELGVLPERCVVFEDAPSGVAAASAAGMRCIAVRTSYVPPEQLGAADLLVDSLEEIDLARLRRLFGPN